MKGSNNNFSNQEKKKLKKLISKQINNITGQNETYIALNLHILLIVSLRITIKWLYDKSPNNRCFASIIMTDIKKFNKLECTILNKALNYNFILNEKDEKDIENLDRYFKQTLCQ